MLFCFGCATNPMVQPQINSLVMAERYDFARQILERNPNAYGVRNQLLYWMDYGYLQHLAGEYQKSIYAFEQAKRMYDQQYTISISQQLATWIINDHMAPFHPEDFERVMINIVQALNFCLQGDYESALVEARDVDSKLKLFNQQYGPNEKNVYAEDAFARLLMGLIYEANGSAVDQDSAWIEYQRSLKIYEALFEPRWGVTIPQILKENLLRLAKRQDRQAFRVYQDRWPELATVVSERDEAGMAEVIVVQYHGLMPLKHQTTIPIPVGQGAIATLAFPSYHDRYFSKEPMPLALTRDHRSYPIETELTHNIAAIAKSNLEDRQARVIAKAVLRTAAKSVAGYALKKAIEKESGQTSARWFGYLSQLYNITSEQADLRSWQILPAQIYLGRLWLPAGSYELQINGRIEREIVLRAGQTRFVLVRTHHDAFKYQGNVHE